MYSLTSSIYRSIDRPIYHGRKPFSKRGFWCHRFGQGSSYAVAAGSRCDFWVTAERPVGAINM